MSVLLDESLDDVNEAGVVVVLLSSGGSRLLRLGSTDSSLSIVNSRVDEGTDGIREVGRLNTKSLSKLPDHRLDILLVGNVLYGKQGTCAANL